MLRTLHVKVGRTVNTALWCYVMMTSTDN